MSEQNKDGKDLATKTQGGALATYDYGSYAGAGTEHAKEGGRVPFLELLQPLSKAVNGNDAVDGARPGMFIIKDSGDLFDGKKGVAIIALTERRAFVEWTPRDKGGGWVAEYKPSDPIVAKALSANGGKKQGLKTEAGNDLVETYYMPILAFPNGHDISDLSTAVPCILTFEKSKLAAREKMWAPFRKIPEAKRPPLFAAKLRLRSEFKKWKKGEGYTYVLEFAEGNDFLNSLLAPDAEGADKFFAHAFRFHEQYSKGIIQNSTRDSDGDADADDGDIPF